MLLPLLLLALPFPQLAFDNGGERVPLRVDGSVFCLRLDPALDEEASRALLADLPGLPAGELAGSGRPGKPWFLTPERPVPSDEALALAARWRSVPGVRAASPRLWAPGDDPYFLTDEVLVRWKPATPQERRAELTDGLVRTATLSYSVNPGEVFRVPQGADPLAVANRLAASGAVEFAIPDFQLRRVTYGSNDPLFPQQWHLESTGQNGARPDADVDAQAAWSVTRGDPRAIVAVVDEGMDLGHPDLDLVQGRDVLDDDDDPKAEDGLFGLFPENHATAVAGVAAARGDNGIGVSGVAQQCRVMPIRFLSSNIFNPPTTQDEAEAFDFARTHGASVVNNSWGPVFGAPLPASTKAAIDDCNENGRGGLGMVIFFAAGNSGSNNSNNGYASYPGVVAVSAVTDQEELAYYSSFGPGVDVCAPSNGGVNGITTTDRRGRKGYSNGDYTDTFGGTSSASPCAAGVMLLILSANPNLTREQALAVLYASAEKVDPANGGYDVFGHSWKYGFGRVNADAAVQMALTGPPSDAFTLQGPATAAAGSMVTVQLSGAPPLAPFAVFGSYRNDGSVMKGHAFEVGVPSLQVASGSTDAVGSASASFVLPASAAGRTVYVEAAALATPGVVQDSTLVAIVVT